ncbi:Vacuolar protein sorting-associated protein 5 [Chytridiales sp. JEL 0842]|nr:Vacuolar protein sorting-associated protein 5 [Chytridiales sp. JEL 0842]
MEYPDELGSGVWDDVPSSSPMLQRDLAKAITVTNPLEPDVSNAFHQHSDTNNSLEAQMKAKLALIDQKAVPASVPSVSVPSTNPLNPLFGVPPHSPPHLTSTMQDPLSLAGATVMGAASHQPFTVGDPLLSNSIGLAPASPEHHARTATDNASITPIAPLDSVSDEGDRYSAPQMDASKVWSPEPPSVTAHRIASIDPLRDTEEPSPEPGFAVGRNIGSNVKDPRTGPGQEQRSKDVKEVTYNYDVNVSEPQKVGSDLINAHISYKVHTKTNNPAYRNPEFSVNRRYRDFLWLYNQLVDRYPGAIIPPIPEKLAIGRFQDEFIEARRAALERCIRKITSHPLLQDDESVRLFLESESFNVDIQQKRKEESKGGFLSVFSSSSTTPSVTSAKIPNDDPFYDTKRAQLDMVEVQLKALLRALEGLIKQRREFGNATFEFGESALALAAIEVNKTAAKHLEVLGEIQKNIKALHEKQAKYDLISLAGVVDEYIRIIGSVKLAFSGRVKSYQAWQTLETNCLRKKELLEKLRVSSKIRSDKISLGETELKELEQQMQDSKRAYEETSALLRIELDRYDKEKIVDFTIAMQGFIRSLVETQKEVIMLWESYFSKTGQEIPR